jgi:hypothetical protein
MGAAEQQKSGVWWAMFILGTAIIGGLFGGIFGMLNSGGQKRPAEITSSDDRRDIQGEWVLIMGENAGRPQPVPSGATVVFIVFKGDRFTITAPGSRPSQAGSFLIHREKQSICMRPTPTLPAILRTQCARASIAWRRHT